MTLISRPLQDTVAKSSHGIALPEAKGQKEWVPVQGRKALPQQWGSISPQDAGVLWGTGLPLLNWLVYASYLYLCSDEGFPLERDMSTHRKPVCYLYHTVHLANMVQKGMAGADHEMSFFALLKFSLTFSDWPLSSRWGLAKEMPSFLFILALKQPIFSPYNSYRRDQNILKYWTVLQ